MKDPSLAFLVVAEPMREEASRDVENKYVVPLAALDAMDGGEQNQRTFDRCPGQHLAQPALERGDLGVERRHRFQRGQVVGVSGAVCLAA